METTENSKLRVMPIPKLLINMSIPVVLSLLVQSLYNIVDSIFVARVSEAALTATSLAYPIQILMIAVAVGTSVGANALLSRRLGEGDQEAVSNVATTGVCLSAISAAVFILLGLFASRALTAAFTSDEEIREMCRQYLLICMVFCPGTFLETLYQRFLQATGNSFLSMISLMVGAGTNIILDPILIFGLLGAPALGIRGAAIATVIGQWLGALVAILLHHFRNGSIRLKLRGFRPRADMVGQVYRVGVPTIITLSTGCAMVTAMNAILISWSSTAVAFFGVFYKLQSFLFIPLNGLGQVVIPIVGFNYGAREKERVGKTVRTVLPVAVIVALIGTALFTAIPGALLSLFSPSAEMLALGVPALRIISVTFPFAAVTMQLGYILSGLGNGVVNMVGTLLRQFVLLIPIAYLLVRFVGVDYVWYAFWLSEGAAVVYSAISSRYDYRKKLAALDRPSQER